MNAYVVLMIFSAMAGAVDIESVFLSSSTVSRRKVLIPDIAMQFVPGSTVSSLKDVRKAVRPLVMGFGAKADTPDTGTSPAVLTERFDDSVFSEAIYNTDRGRVVRLGLVAFLGPGTEVPKQKILLWCATAWGPATDAKAFEEHSTYGTISRYAILRWDRRDIIRSVAFEPMSAGVGVTISISTKDWLSRGSNRRELPSSETEALFKELGITSTLTKKRKDSVPTKLDGRKNQGNSR